MRDIGIGEARYRILPFHTKNRSQTIKDSCFVSSSAHVPTTNRCHPSWRDRRIIYEKDRDRCREI